MVAATVFVPTQGTVGNGIVHGFHGLKIFPVNQHFRRIDGCIAGSAQSTQMESGPGRSTIRGFHYDTFGVNIRRCTI